MKREWVRRPHSGAVRSWLRVALAAVLHDAVAGAHVVQQEVAERVDGLVADGGAGTVNAPRLITVPAGDGRDVADVAVSAADLVEEREPAWASAVAASAASRGGDLAGRA